MGICFFLSDIIEKLNEKRHVNVHLRALDLFFFYFSETFVLPISTGYCIFSHTPFPFPPPQPHFLISPSVSAVVDSLPCANKVGFLMPSSKITPFLAWPCITHKAAGHQPCAHLIPQIVAGAPVLSSPALLFPFIAQLFSGFLSLFSLIDWRREGEFELGWISNDSPSTLL